MCKVQRMSIIPKFTFNAKGGSLRGLSDTSEHIDIHVGSQGLDQADGGGALSFTQRGGGNAADRKSSSAGPEINTYQVLNYIKCCLVDKSIWATSVEYVVRGAH